LKLRVFLDDLMNPYEAPQAAAVTLADLQVGQVGTITDLAGSDSITARLLEMGLIPGTTVSLIGKAPLGDPLEFELRGYRLSLRKSEAQRVAIISPPSMTGGNDAR